MMICITGTPGTGKTTIASILNDRGYKKWDFLDIAKDCVDGIEDEEYLIDEECLKNIKVEGIVESHLSHFMNCDLVIVLRAHLKDIEGRLKQRGYNKKKIMENLEAEALGIISLEAREIYGDNIFEIMNDDLVDTINKIISIINGEKVQRETYDLSEEILNWY